MNPLGRLRAQGLAAACGLTAWLSVSAQSPSVATEIARDLATRIATAVAPLQEIHLAAIDRDPQSAATVRAVAAALTTELRARNIRVLASPPPSSPQETSAPRSSDRARADVLLLCSTNLRDHVCSVDIRRTDGREVAVVSRARNDSAAAASASLSALDVRPIFAQRLAILDLAATDEQLVVLDVSAVTVYARSQQGWQSKASTPLPTTRPWPRDVRGRLSTEAGAISVFLPGVSCRGTIDPLKINCIEGAEAWPVGVPGATVAAGSNFFTSPNTPSFFTAAPLGSGGKSPWLLAATDGRLLLLDPSLEIRQSMAPIGDDIAAITTACAGRQIIAAIAERDDAEGDSIRAYDVPDRDFVARTPPVSMPGRITALWEASAAGFALVVVHNRNSGRYEAFDVGISCAR